MPPVQPRANPFFPHRPGTYALILHLARSQIIGVGRLGAFDFPAGWYVYVGSALGPGGLAGRLGRHLAPGALHWHVDYLRQEAYLEAICCLVDDQRLEHLWAITLQDRPGVAMPCPGFGASDCRCLTHLFHFQCEPGRVLFSSFAGRAFTWIQI